MRRTLAKDQVDCENRKIENKNMNQCLMKFESKSFRMNDNRMKIDHFENKKKREKRNDHLIFAFG